jgi:hypothetical protein
MSDREPTSDADDVIELPDGRRLTRIPRGPDGEPVRPGYEIGHADLGGRPPVRRIPDLRILETYAHLHGEIGGALAAYPAFHVLREGSEIDINGHWTFRILKARQDRTRKHRHLREGEVLFELILESA